MLDDAAMMRNQSSWPAWPVLPVKKYNKPGEMPDVGTMFAGQTKVFKCNMFDLSGTEDLTKLDSFDYPSVEAIIADGWRVD